jgi:hypothetical protein|nr:MAG TPA: hypothetical protein [Crassvirales sp.]
MAQLINIIQDEATYKASNTSIVTCVFSPTTEKSSSLATMLAKGAFGSANSYTLSFDLSRIFPELIGENGKFKRMAAYKEFLGIMPIGINIPEINCFDIPVSEISDFEGVTFERDGETRTIKTYHLAVMGDREQAVQLAKSGLVNGIAKGRLTPIDGSETTVKNGNISQTAPVDNEDEEDEE